jgi:hypothetical protein
MFQGEQRKFAELRVSEPACRELAKNRIGSNQIRLIERAEREVGVVLPNEYRPSLRHTCAGEKIDTTFLEIV